MSFPDVLEKDLNDICIVSLDTIAAGCIHAYAQNGNLDRNRFQVLNSCLNDLDSVLPELDDYSKEYFLVLKEICVGIIKDTKS